jgi:hypothetical protein
VIVSVLSKRMMHWSKGCFDFDEINIPGCVDQQNVRPSSGAQVEVSNRNVLYRFYVLWV